MPHGQLFCLTIQYITASEGLQTVSVPYVTKVSVGHTLALHIFLPLKYLPVSNETKIFSMMQL